MLARAWPLGYGWAMTMPFNLPDWLPWWTTFAVLVPVGLFALAFLLMPFSVFGLKGRLDTIEARLDEIQGEIRSLSLRLPEPGGRYDIDSRPPIPPAARERPAYVPEPRRAEPAATEFDRPPPPANRPVIVRRPDPRATRAEPSFDPR